MHDRILKRMQEKIRTRQYVMTLHAEEVMDYPSLTLSEAFLLAESLSDRRNILRLSGNT